MTRRRSIFSSPLLLGISLLGSLIAGIVGLSASLSVQIAVLGVLVSILAGLLFTWLDEQARRDVGRADLGGVARVVDALQDDPELAGELRRICNAFLALAEQTDPVFRAAVLTRLLALGNELELVSRGKITFRETESWRAAYRDLLQDKSLRLYRSVAWVKSPSYWQDAPGRQSIRANYDAMNRGVLIERIFILPAELWPAGQLLPNEIVLPWIMDQYNHGVWVLLCLEADIAAEPDLPLDFGIYGNSAVGRQDMDDDCRTREFLLEFNPEAVKLAEDRWRRLTLHATPLRTLLDGEHDKP
ncbi:hypothetical protein [Aeoliella sp. SH292]|uniref:hypothetical protein n=1 Tax=Aeoliella sp. SH292 TaxID=3454464 RepID=UPI003F9BC09A